jgi:hypothetical protein
VLFRGLRDQRFSFTTVLAICLCLSLPDSRTLIRKEDKKSSYIIMAYCQQGRGHIVRPCKYSAGAGPLKPFLEIQKKENKSKQEEGKTEETGA